MCFNFEDIWIVTKNNDTQAFSKKHHICINNIKHKYWYHWELKNSFFDIGCDFASGNREIEERGYGEFRLSIFEGESTG